MELLAFPPAYGEPTGSPFTNKALMMLEATGHAYRIDHRIDSHKAPKKKFPVLKVDDRLIPDSEEIAAYLEQTFGIDFDAGLDSAARAHAHALIRMVEGHLYFITLSNAWVDEATWVTTRRAIFDPIPWPMRPILSRIVRKSSVAQAMGQGIGRHSIAERTARFEKDLSALAETLGDQAYMFGAEPSRADYTIIPALRFIQGRDEDGPLQASLGNFPKLVAYAKRGGALYPSAPV